MFRILLTTVFLVLCSVPHSGQPDVTVYWNPSNRTDTIMDFGVTLEGLPTTRTFTVVNNGSATVSIFETRPEADPYYLIVNVPEVDPADPRKEEFQRVEALPYHIPPGRSRSFTVEFRAFANNPLFPPDRVVEALLQLRVVDSAGPTGPSFDKSFRLRALKTTKILASTTPWVRYDSVYVNPRPLPPTRPYVVDNAVDKRIDVARQILEMQSTVVGPPEIEVDTFSVVSFGPQDSLVWTTRYVPYNRGLDSAHFHLVYRPDATAGWDTVTASISGVGVEQRLILVSASSTDGILPVVIRGDTVDFGAVPADGVGVTARIVVRNDGNLNIGVDSETKVGTQKDTAAFLMRRSLRDGGPTIFTAGLDTLEVSFVPTLGGDHVMRFVVNTDLQRRGIHGVPDGAQTTQWVFTGFGQRPQIQVTPAAIDFGTVVLLPSCVSTVERTITVRNLGNAELLVDSIRVSPPTARIVVDPQSFRLAPGGSQVVRALFEPTDLGAFSGTVTFYTNSLIRAYDVAYTASVVEPTAIDVRVDSVVAARPGRVVGIDVHVTPDAVATTDRCVIALSYNPTLLRYRGVAQVGTASEGAQVVAAGESSPGVLRISLQGPANFTSIDRLVTILFDSFLGEQASTDVAFTRSETTFGNAGCPSVLTVRPSSGMFRLDSLCGLDYKTVVTTSRLAAGVFPNPAADRATVTIYVSDARTFDAAIVDAVGIHRPLFSGLRLDAGVHVIPMAVDDLAPGGYTIVVRSGARFQTIPFMVGR